MNGVCIGIRFVSWLWYVIQKPTNPHDQRVSHFEHILGKPTHIQPNTHSHTCCTHLGNKNNSLAKS